MAFADPKENIKHLELKERDIVADFGTGSGYYAMELARRVGGDGIVYAVDVNKSSLEHLATKARDAKLTNINVLWADAEEVGGTKLKDGLVDSVVIANTLFQIENKEGMAKEAARILKKGKEVLVIDWDSALPGLGPRSGQTVTADMAETIFSKSGFSPVKKFDAGDHHWGMIFRKL